MSDLAIEQQERQGQQDLCRMMALPRHCSEKCKVALERFGARFGDDVDDLLVNVTLPAGWTLRPVDNHIMWTDLIDNNGVTRAYVFYKASVHDRRAAMTVRHRYIVHWLYRVEGGEFDRAVVAEDCKTGVVLKQFCQYRAGKSNAEVDAARKAAREWLEKHYPDYLNPGAYW